MQNTAKLDNSKNQQLKKKIPICHSIPMTQVKVPIPWAVILLFIISFYCCVDFFSLIIDRYTLNTSLTLENNISIVAIMKNCDIKFSEYDGLSYVNLQTWLHDTEEFRRNEPYIYESFKVDEYQNRRKFIKIKLAKTHRSRFMLCSVNFYLNRNFTFHSLNITYIQEETYTNVNSTVPINAISNIEMKILHGIINVQQLNSPSIHLYVNDGAIYFKLNDNDKLEQRVYVKTNTATVDITSEKSLKIKLPNKTAKNSLFRSSVIHTNFDDNYAYFTLETHSDYKGSHSHINVNLKRGSFYANVQPPGLSLDVPLQTWAGVKEILKPQLSNWSLDKFPDITEWFKSELTQYWLLDILEYKTYLQGQWQFLSSPVYLFQKPSLILFSAGLLKPDVKHLRIHITGLYCRSSDDLSTLPTVLDNEESLDENIEDRFETSILPSDMNNTNGKQNKKELGEYIEKTLHHSQCENQILTDVYLVLWTLFKQFNTDKSVLAFHSSKGHILKFNILEDAIIQNPVTFKDAWYFHVAITVNVCFAAMLAYAAQKYIRSIFVNVQANINAENILCTASHRLDHQITRLDNEDWSISVTAARFPVPGFIFRWNNVAKRPYAVIGIVFQASDRQNSTNSPQITTKTNLELFNKSQPLFIYFSKSAVQAADSIAVAQNQLFVPWKNPCQIPIACHQQYELQKNFKYRAQLQTLNSLGYTFDQSSWSPEVSVPEEFTFLDYPLLILKQLCSRRYSSLEIFIDRHVVQTSPAKFTLHFSCFSLETITSNPELQTTQRRVHSRMAPRTSAWNPNRALTTFNSYIDNNSPVTQLDEDLSYLVKVAIKNNTSKVFDIIWESQSILIKGKPQIRQSEQKRTQNIIQLKPQNNQKIILEHNRMSQKYLTFIVADGQTNKEIAAGFLELSQVYASYMKNYELSEGSLYLRIRLNNFDTAGYWGTIAVILTLPEYRKHFVRDKIVPEPTVSFETDAITQKPITSPNISFMLNYSVYKQNKIDRLQLNRLCHGALSMYNMKNGQALMCEKPSTSSIKEKFFVQYNYDDSDYFSFENDYPGVQYLEGTDSVISWTNARNIDSSFDQSADSTLSNVFLHIIDFDTNVFLFSINSGQPIPNTGTCSWTVECSFNPNQISRSCYFILTKNPLDKTKTLTVLARSQMCHIVKCTPFSEFEIFYAAFCRTHNLEMEHLSDLRLAEAGLVTRLAELKVCLNLRNPLPFEYPIPLVQCQGQCIPSSATKMVDSINSTNSDSLIGIYKAVNRDINIFENCILDQTSSWWTEGFDSHLLQLNIPFHTIFRPLINRTPQIKVILSNYFNLSDYHAFRLLRRIEFEFGFYMVQYMLLFIQFIWCSFIPISILIGYLLYETIYWTSPHHAFKTHYSPSISEFVYHKNIGFFLTLKFPGSFIILANILATMFFFSAVVVAQIGRKEKFMPMVNRVGKFLNCFYLYLAFWILIMISLWIVIGALINSGTFLPYAVMSCTVAYTIYTVSSNFSETRSFISKFINQNLNLLLSIAIEHWFENYYRDTKNRGNVENDAHKIKRQLEFHSLIEMSQKKLIYSKFQSLIQDLSKETTICTMNQNPADVLRKETCAYKYKLASATQGNQFVFNKEKLLGLEEEPFWPSGTRFASVAEFEKHSKHIKSLLHGFEVACLKDGILYGPEFNYVIETQIENGSSFAYGIVAVPIYPHPINLDFSLKVQFIFNAFDNDEDSYMNHVEITLWHYILHKVNVPDTWSESIVFLSQNYNINNVDEKGINKEQLELYYINREEQLDSDFLYLFEVNDSITSKNEESSVDVSTESSDFSLNVSDSESSSSDDSLESFNSSSSKECEVDGNTSNHENLDHLKKIFDVITQEQRLKRSKDCDYSDSYIAQQLVDVQFETLSSIFSTTTVLKSSNYLKKSKSSTLLELNKNDSTLIAAIKTISLNASHKLLAELVDQYREMLDFNNIHHSISHFYDTAITDFVQNKSRRILSTQIDFQNYQVTESTREYTQQSYPVTSYEAFRKFKLYCTSFDVELRQKFNTIKLCGSFQTQLRVTLLVQALVHIKILPPEDIEKHYAQVHLKNEKLKEVVLWLPTKRECFTFIGNLIELVLKTDQDHFNIDHFYEVAQKLFTSYYWIESFYLLLRLMGISLEEDNLTHNSETCLYLDNSLKQNTNVYFANTDGDLKKLNKEAVQKVFNQLSHNSGFLPVELADEAIFLLTDNCLNAAGVVACLKYIEVISCDAIKAAQFYNNYFIPEKNCYNIENATEIDEDILDWTEYRYQQIFTGSLEPLFENAKISQTMMTKSQMIHLVNDIRLATGSNETERCWKDKNIYAQSSFVSGVKSDESKVSVNFVMFHKALKKCGLSVNLTQSQLFWLLYLNCNCEQKQYFIPAYNLANFTIACILQPAFNKKKGCDSWEPFKDTSYFDGWLTYELFYALIKQLRITISDINFYKLWNSLPKDPFKLFFKNHSTKKLNTIYLKINMDSTGMNPFLGDFIQISTIRKYLPQILMRGIWYQTVETLIQSRLRLNVSQKKLQYIFNKYENKKYAAPLLPYKVVPHLLFDTTIEGLSFGMLRELLYKMRLQIPEQNIKRMFDLMDVNHDHRLDFNELVAGFDLLFKRFMPHQIICAVGVLYIDQFYTTVLVVSCLIALFSFIGFALSAFVNLQSGISAAVQSVVAIVGAVGLQSGATESALRIQERMKIRISDIVGKDLVKILELQEEAQKQIQLSEKSSIIEKPSQIIYKIPKKHLPDPLSPYPCVTYYPEDFITLKPIVKGGTDNLKWKINPKLPKKLNLSFDSFTGIISGCVSTVNDNCSDDSFQHKATKNIIMPKRTFKISASNNAGTATTYISFQIKYPN